MAALLSFLAGPVAAQTPFLWLSEIDGVMPEFEATLSLDRPGFVQGRAPRNSYSARMANPLPDFRTDSILTTKMACPDLAA